MPSLSFIYVFLPLSLFCYYAIPHKQRPLGLLLISLIYLLMVQPWMASFAAGLVLVDYIAIRAMKRYAVARKLLLGFVLLKNLAMVVVSGLFFENGAMPLFLGAAVYAVSSTDAALTFYREEDTDTNFANFGLFCLFFPRLYAGPVQPYREFTPQLEQIHFNFKCLHLGFGQFVQGALKVVLIAGQCAGLVLTISEFPAGDVTVLSLWVLTLSFAFWLYFTLSGYSDMARGLGVMFGIFLPMNFYYPYQSHGVNDFTERFNSTLSAFLKRNIGAPLVDKGAVPEILGLFWMGILFGLWFGPNVNYLLWGIILCLLMLAERRVIKLLSALIPTFFRRIFTLGIMLLSFALIIGQSVHYGIEYMRGMLGFGNYTLYNEMIMYQIASNLVLLILAAFFSTSAVNRLTRLAQKTIPRVADAVSVLINAALLVVLTASIL